jgi:hypothetical protein
MFFFLTTESHERVTIGHLVTVIVGSNPTEDMDFLLYPVYCCPVSVLENELWGDTGTEKNLKSA